jgi:hypothetical protein
MKTWWLAGLLAISLLVFSAMPSEAGTWQGGGGAWHGGGGAWHGGGGAWHGGGHHFHGGGARFFVGVGPVWPAPWWYYPPAQVIVESPPPVMCSRRPYTWSRRPRRSTGISVRASMRTIRRRRHVPSRGSGFRHDRIDATSSACLSTHRSEPLSTRGSK